MKVLSTTLRTDSTEAMSLSIVRRGASTRTQSRPALTVLELPWAHADRVSGAGLDQHLAARHQEEGVGVVVFPENHIPLARHEELALEHELAQLQAVDAQEQGQVVVDEIEHLRDALAARERGEFALKQRLVGRRDGFPQREFHRLVALVHRLLDERIAAERADDVEPFDVGLVAVGEPRHGVGIVARELHSEPLDQLARRNPAQARDDAMAFDGIRAVGRLHLEAQRHVSADVLDLHRRAAVAALELALLDGVQHQRQVSLLAARELLVAVDENHLVLLGERDRVLDRGVSRADHDDGLALVGLGIVELILHARQALARDAQPAQVALEADRENHPARVEGLARLGADLERPALSGDGDDLLAVTDVDAQFRDLGVPGVEHRLALARGKAQGAAQRQDLRLGHDVLALLVLVDRVRGLVGRLEQHVGDGELGAVRGGGQPRRARADDADLVPPELDPLIEIRRHGHLTVLPRSASAARKPSGLNRSSFLTCAYTRSSAALAERTDLSSPRFARKLSTLPIAIVACSAPA
jgi:hypothetical protein